MLDILKGPQTWLMEDELYRRFCALVHEATGLSFSENSRFFFEKRVEMRMAAIGVATARDYYQYLLYDSERAAEWDQLITHITTNETYFMREERQLRCFQREVMPLVWERSAGKRVRIWSAGCSTGEEAYTIAILLREAGLYPEDRVEILATDINTRVLAKAKSALYTEAAFRAVDSSFRQQWFAPEGAGQFRLREEIRRRVSFSRFNLFEMDKYNLLLPFDVIFCRNVIIYFDLEAKVKVMERFHDKMRPGGFLLLGHSESLISVTDRFKLIHLPTDLVYTKEAP
ncbi:MAG: protein-glutamate O-methyltransferase CheR [Acidobacteriota bacterium]